jgi:hypothetical protein
MRKPRLSAGLSTGELAVLAALLVAAVGILLLLTRLAVATALLIGARIALLLLATALRIVLVLRIWILVCHGCCLSW